MFKFLFVVLLLTVLTSYFINGCLITNCPRGGKRSGKYDLVETNIKQCVSCGPGRLGQCFGPNICCGPFGCLIGTLDTIRCQRDGGFQEREPCIAGTSFCKKNTGRCAFDGICCNQDSCHVDKLCSLDEKKGQDNLLSMDIYNLMNYQSEISNE